MNQTCRPNVNAIPSFQLVPTCITKISKRRDMSNKSKNMSFRDAVNAEFHTRCLGENGMPEYTDLGVGSDILALSQMVRTGDPGPLVDKILQEGSAQDIADLMVLIFATRNTRGGKGEKTLAYHMFLRVYCNALPNTALQLMKLFPHFGYWKDLLLLIKLIKENPSVPQSKKDAFFQAAVAIMVDQLSKDIRELQLSKNMTKTPSISLLAKWLPRENAALDKSTGVVDGLAKGLFVSAAVAGGASAIWQSSSKRFYRKTVSQLTAQLRLPEVLLSAQREEEIDFGRVASRATMLYRRVFLNVDEHCSPRSENARRVALAKRFVEHIIEKGINGAQLMPHEIVKKIMRGNTCECEELVLAAQWTSLRESVLAQIQTAAKGVGGEPTRLIPLSDVSGSMLGTPMEVSIALGILLSEITHPAFRDMVMTFETTPQWHRLNPSATIAEKVRSLESAPWGGSTDFSAAYRLILEVARKHSLKREDVPNLIVFSDMQFNEAGHNCTEAVTMHELVAEEFKETAEILGWEDQTPTTMVYWNLRNTSGHPVSRDTVGAVMLAGFSPSLLKLVMNGRALEDQEIEVVKADGTVFTEKVRVTPGEMLRKMLDDELYDPVRAILGSSTEGKLKEFEILSSEIEEEGGFEIV